MTNQLNTEHEVIEDQVELLLDKQDYLDYIDADMKAFIEVKAEALGFDVIGL